MIKANVEYGLQGAFKVDVYSGNHFVESTDWFSNFITQTGLMYPVVLSFANCFRFLTLGGDNSTQNDGGSVVAGNATTGVASPITAFTDSNNITQDGRWIGYTGYETGIAGNNSSCLTRLTDTGPIFFRAWGIPTGGLTVGQSVLNIGEFAVSPSGGGVGIGGGFGAQAFSRVRRPLPLPQGYRAIVSYQLKVNIRNSSLTLMPSGTFSTGNANITNDADMVAQWGQLSGYFRQVWCGLSCVDRWGASVITKYGNGMEPSLSDFSNYYLYFSPDNAQFDVDSLSGRQQFNPTGAWASDGIMTPLGSSLRQPIDVSNTNRQPGDLGDSNSQNTIFLGPEQVFTNLPDNSLTPTPYNIRLGSDAQALKTANLANYSWDISTGTNYSAANFNYQAAGGAYVNAGNETISYANVGGSGIQLSRGPWYHERAIFSSRIFRLPMDSVNYSMNNYTGRRKNITRKVVFSPASSLGYNTRFGSMVFAYKPPGTYADGQVTYYPTIDTLFYDSSGRAQLQHYRQISGIYLVNRGSGLVNSVMTISGSLGQGNILRNVSVECYHGPLVNGVPGPLTGVGTRVITGGSGTIWPGTTWTGNFTSNPANVGSGSGNLGFGDLTNGYSGWGSIYGAAYYINNDANTPYDIGIANHNTGALSENPTGQLYWPNVVGGTPLTVVFTGLVFSGWKSGSYYVDNAGASTANLAALGFARPSGVVYHFDFMGPTGYRLLPNFGIANTDPTNNIYPPSYGGALPGFSMDNGLEVYMDVVWTSDCSDAQNCNQPPSS